MYPGIRMEINACLINMIGQIWLVNQYHYVVLKFKSGGALHGATSLNWQAGTIINTYF